MARELGLGQRAAAVRTEERLMPRVHPPAVRRVDVRLLQAPGCPLAGRMRVIVGECLGDGAVPVQFEVVEGDFPSPTLLVDGVDVVTGAAPATEPCCRLDLPSRDQVLAAIQRAAVTAWPRGSGSSASRPPGGNG
jgi:hypothetical protein